MTGVLFYAGYLSVPPSMCICKIPVLEVGICLRFHLGKPMELMTLQGVIENRDNDDDDDDDEEEEEDDDSRILCIYIYIYTHIYIYTYICVYIHI